MGHDLLNLDWSSFAASLETRGFALTGPLLSKDDCQGLVKNYNQDDRYRSTIRMARYNFGQGEYRYFAYPLPGKIAALRTTLYPPLANIANDWMKNSKQEARFPASHKAYLKRCHDAGQQRPTPLILKYGEGDYNCLHQDLYGEHVFPLQLAILLNDPAEDFTGGELILTEQRPRMQSKAHVVPLTPGGGVIFAVNERPVKGASGYYRVKMRHGVSEVLSGKRHTLGIIFHDAA